MADNEIEDAIEENTDELLSDEGEVEAGDDTKKKRFSKPLLIKIAIGLVVVLLLAGGAYFFLAEDPQAEQTLDPESIEESVSDENVDDFSELEAESAGSEENSDADTMLDDAPEQSMAKTESKKLSKISKAFKESGAMSDPDEELDSDALMGIKEDIKALQEENLRLQKEVSGLRGTEVLPVEQEGAVKEPGTDAKPRANQYSDIYRDEPLKYPEVRKAQQEPVPEPKWGERR